MTARRFRDMADVKTWNDEMVARYDLDRFHAHPSPLVRLVESRRVARIFALLAPGPDDRVLEGGCGAGHLLARLPARRADLEHTVIGPPREQGEDARQDPKS